MLFTSLEKTNMAKTKLRKDQLRKGSETSSPTKRKRRKSSKWKEPGQPHIFQIQEVCGRGIFRENPDEPLLEMPTQPADLPIRPHNWAETESGEIDRAL
ncbi:hypothetical protein F4782DRAFT_509144 [Xylaria castorea]|nr:hypothetical protein F4782DRAFT_509144 [Xylaria castorea]